MIGRPAGRISGRRWGIGFIAALLIAALLLAALGMADPTGRWRPWTAYLAPEEDGSWIAIAIDGQPVADHGYRVSITDGKVAGGRDACNDWAYGPPDPKGGPTIETTLVGCGEDDPLRKAYWALANAGQVTLLADGRLRLAGNGHEALFRRCTWKTVRTHTETSSSEERLCLPH